MLNKPLTAILATATLLLVTGFIIKMETSTSTPVPVGSETPGSSEPAPKQEITPAGAQAPAPQPDILANIRLDTTMTKADALGMRTSLGWLRDHLPEWYAYIEGIEPFTLSVDESLGQDDILADAWCCDEHGGAVIRLGTHLDQWKVSEALKEYAPQALQFEILSTIIHEATHIRDERTGQTGEKTNTEACIAAENSAYSKQVEFARALTTVNPAGDSTAREKYRLVAEKELESATTNIESIGWRVACF